MVESTVGLVIRGRSVFQAERALRSAAVSNDCGSWPASGTLCARLPRAESVPDEAGQLQDGATLGRRP
jgi:hypothetical protein